MKKRLGFLKKLQLHHLLAILMVVLTLVLTPAYAANAIPSDIRNVEHQESRDPASGPAVDLSDIPNLEQMDYGTLEKHVGDVPDDHAPLFNPDNGKNVQIKDKTSDSDRTITTEDFKKNKSNSDSAK